MTSFTKANGFASPLKWLCVFFALMGSFLANAQNTSNNFSQVTTNPPQDPIKWIYGIVNKNNSQYSEGMAVPERIALSGVTETGSGTHTLTFKVQYTRKGTNYAFDFLTSWATAVSNAGGKLDQLPSVACDPHSGQSVPSVCGDASHVYQGTISGEPQLDVIGSNGDLTPYLDNGTDRFFTIYSTVPVSNASITANATPEDAGSNSYLLYTISWTNDNAAAAPFDVVIEFAAHLAKTETGYNGSGYIKGAPYHIKLDQLDGGSLGSQDNNVSVYQNTCDVQTTDATLTTCATPGATVDLTSANITSTSNTTVTWFYDADLTQAIDPSILITFPASNTTVYADVSNGSCESVATVTIQVNPLPVVTCPGNSEVCISTAAYALTGATPTGGTYSGDGVSNGMFDPSTAGVGTHTITYTYTDGNTCSNSCTFTITVDAASVGGSVSADATVCRSGNSGTLTLSGYTGTIVKWQSSTDNFVSDIHDISNTTATQSYSNLTQTTWFRAVVQSGVCDPVYSTPAKITVGDCATTYTKGFWASTGKEKCGTNRQAIDILRSNFGSSPGTCSSNLGTAITFGSTTTGYTFSLYPNVDFYLQTDGTCKPSQSFIPIQKLLPGGNTPDVLRNPTNVTWCNHKWSYSIGKVTYTLIGTDCKGSTYSNILNNLLAQTIALKFNLVYTPVLGGVHITGTNLAFNYLDCNSVVGTQSSTQSIPCSVLNALGSNNTINDLYTLANKVLGQEVTSVSPSDITAALNAINVGFDGGKILVSQTGTCGSGPITLRQLPQVQTIADPEVIAYPNPYTSRVNFVITSPVAGRASLQVYNELGQNVKTVYNGYLQAGQKQTVSFDVPPAMQSMLIYKLQIGNQQITGKVLQAKE